MEKSERFQVGDRVRHSSLGLVGTVAGPESGGQIPVDWDGKGRMGAFQQNLMRLSTPAHTRACPRAVDQPVPMTRAARVLAGMMSDPYNVQYELEPDEAARAEVANESARLRMARMTLDRPMEYDQRRWERLVLAKVPVGRR